MKPATVGAYIVEGRKGRRMEHKIFEMEIAGRTLTVDTGKYAEQAGGACLMRCGDTAVLVTATASSKPREGIDFFPLSVEFEEKMYSVGKIPGGFIKREEIGRASWRERVFRAV